MNAIIEKLRNQFLPEAVFKYEICDLVCGSHCQEYLGCTKWRKYKGSKERVKDFVIVLRENSDNDTLAHEFTHAFLTYHYDFTDHHVAREKLTKRKMLVFGV